MSNITLFNLIKNTKQIVNNNIGYGSWWNISQNA